MVGGFIMENKILSAENMVVQVASTLAIENMYMTKQFKKQLLLVAQGKKSSKELLTELDKKYVHFIGNKV